MTNPVVVVIACTAAAEDNGMCALRDVAAAADGADYRVIGGHMVRLLRHVYQMPGIPRVTFRRRHGHRGQIGRGG